LQTELIEAVELGVSGLVSPDKISGDTQNTSGG